jgi:hypothetical protein
MAWRLVPPELQIHAAYRWVEAELCVTVVDIELPLPTWATSAPVDTSRMEIPYGVGPTSWLAVAVRVTAPPTGVEVAVAARDTE